MDNGSEMEWMPYWCAGNPNGASEDTLVLGTFNNEKAGCWADAPSSYDTYYICEKND